MFKTKTKFSSILNTYKKIMRENKTSIISSLVVATILIIVFVTNNITPFGNQTFMKSDCFHQYIPLLSQLYDKLTSGESLMYSLSTGLGTSTIGNVINYLLSPFTWLIIAFGKENIPTMFTISVSIKAILSSFTMAFFLRKKADKNTLSIVPFSVLYALSYYFIAYYWNIMWMDALYLLPLICYGIYSLIHKNKFVPYIVSLSFAILTNYYMGFMLCIGSVIYFVYEYVSSFSLKTIYKEENNNIFKKYKILNTSLKFVIASLLAAGLSAIVILPMYSILQTTSATANNTPVSLQFGSIISLISNHFYYNKAVFYTNNNSVVPNVYCGIFTLISISLLFISKKITKKEKALSAGVLLFFISSFCINILNYIWHAAHFPNSLPYRFSYIYIFFLILFAYKGFSQIKNLSLSKIIITTISWIAIVVLCCSISAPKSTALTLPVTIILFVIYGLMLIIAFKKQSNLITVILICLTFCELLLPCIKAVEPFNANSLYELSDDAKFLKDTAEENVFYRAELLDHTASMPCVLYDYNGISTFTSVSYENISKLHMRLGVNANGLNSAYYQPQTPIYNMMMSVNYLSDNNSPFTLNEHEFTPYKTNPATNNIVYKNKYSSSIAFGSDTNLEETFDINSASPFEVQNRFAQSVTKSNITPLIHVKNTEFISNGFELEIKENEMGYIIKYKIDPNIKDPYIKIATTPTNNGYYYSCVQNALTFKHETQYDDVILTKALDVYPGSVAVGNIKPQTTFTTTLTPEANTPTEGEFYYFVATCDNEIVDSLYEKITDNGIAEVVDFKEDYVKFNISNTTDYIYTSIPYDKNWQITMDGKQIDINDVKKTADALCLIEVSPGNHTIEFQYKQSNLILGATISGASIIALVAWVIVSNKKTKSSQC